MFDHLFENRNTTVTNLLKLGDCLARSLRENIEIFSIDSEKKSVAYLTESGKVLSGKYNLGSDILLEDIQIQDSELFTDNETFNTYVNENVSHFVGELNSNQYADAQDSFSNILSLWENRLKFESVKKKLTEKSLVFSENQTILATEEFQRLLEITPQFVDFLQENKEEITQVQEIENAIKLSNSVSKAFNFPRLSYSTLEEQKTYKISKGLNKSVYELICNQELVKKELLESKKSFEDVWATSSKIRTLASLVYSDSEDAILEALVDAVVDIPYLALTTKKQLLESLGNAFSIGDTAAISTKDLKTFVSRIFEMKKPLKDMVISLLNEKYGINVQNLKETATFEGLANTQVVIFESLTRLAPKGSLIRNTLSDFGKVLRGKNGVEVIDVNELLQECFDACDYDEFCTDFNLIEEFSFESLLDETVNITELLETTKERLLLDKKKKKKKKKNGDPLDLDDIQASNDDNLGPKDKAHKEEAEKDEKITAAHGEQEDDSVIAAEKKSKVKSTKEETEEETLPPSEDSEETPTADPLTKEEFLDNLKDMQELVQGMSQDEEEDDDEDETPEETTEE